MTQLGKVVTGISYMITPPVRRKLRLAVRRAKRLLEFFAYLSFDTIILSTSGCAAGGGSPIAVVELELVGDYFLWLRYGLTLVEFYEKRNKRVILIINEACEPLAQRHFPSCTIYGIQRRRFIRDLRYRAKVLAHLKTVAPERSFHPTYPRDFIVEDATIRALGAPACGFDAVFPDRPWLDKAWCRRYYEILVPAIPNSHQAVRHRRFLEAIGIPISIEEKLQVSFANRSYFFRRPYFVIAPGASLEKRRWPITNFSTIVRRIANLHEDWVCVIVGTQAELELGGSIAEEVGASAVNLVGGTTIVQLSSLIANAVFVLGNDSAAAHIAATCGVPSVAIVGGGHYGRCFPYETSEVNVSVVPVTISAHMDCFGCDWICRFSTKRNQCFPCLAKIDVETVWAEVSRVFLKSASDNGYP